MAQNNGFFDQVKGDRKKALLGGMSATEFFDWLDTASLEEMEALLDGKRPQSSAPAYPPATPEDQRSNSFNG